MDLATLFQARQYLTLKDHTPGALRLGVNPAILGDARFKGLASGATPLPRGVRGLDGNVVAISVTLRYHAQVLPDDLAMPGPPRTAPQDGPAARIRASAPPGPPPPPPALAALQQTLEQGQA